MQMERAAFMSISNKGSTVASCMIEALLRAQQDQPDNGAVV
jgi:hypothetical protein